jgi:hypothetical protein
MDVPRAMKHAFTRHRAWLRSVYLTDVCAHLNRAESHRCEARTDTGYKDYDDSEPSVDGNSRLCLVGVANSQTLPNREFNAAIATRLLLPS